MEDGAGRSIIFQWLDRIGLGYSIPQFQAYGINSPQALMSLTFEDYDAVGVTELHDRKRLFELVHRVREAASKGADSGAAGDKGAKGAKPKPVAAKPPPSPSRPTAAAAAKSDADGAAASGSGPAPAPPAAPAGPERREAVAALFRGARIGDEALVQKFTDKLMARDRKEVDSFLANPQKLLMYFSKIMGGSASSGNLTRKADADNREEPVRRPHTAASRGSDTDSRPASRERDDRRAPQTADSGRGYDDYSAPRGSKSKWDVPSSKIGSAADKNKELGLERERRMERLQSKGGRRRSAGAGAGGGRAAAAVPETKSGGDDDDGPKITVCVRKRPLSRREKSRKEVDVLKPVSRQTILVYEPKMKVDLTKFTETHEFHFDEVFGHQCTTRDIYKLTAKAMIPAVFRGRNATIFAYGQTGSGKTFTMMGTNDTNSAGKRKHPGIYVLAAQDLFKHLAKPEHADLDLCVSFYEIYGGKLFDLLNARKQLRALADHKEAVQIMGLSDRKVSSVAELLKVIDQGNAARSTGSTGANMDSSRSHAVLQISLHHHKSRKMRGKFSFVDLAGSERGADTTHNDRQTRMEGAEINKSLLALKECIRALYQEHDHTPFRGSKLTQVLKDSFLGNSRTVMIATVSPNITNCEHTLNTLRYAYRVKEIRRPDGEDEVGFEPPHGPDNAEQKRAQQRAEAERQRQREIARRAAAARFDNSSDEEESGSARRPGAGGARGARPARGPQVPDHSDIEVDSLGDSSDEQHASKQDAAETSAANGSDATGAQGAGGEANGHATAPGGDADVRSSAGSGIAEAALIKAHRDQIHEMMDIVKAEMRLVGERNKGEATQMAYMDRVDSLLSKKLALIMQLKAKLTRFREGMAM